MAGVEVEQAVAEQVHPEVEAHLTFLVRGAKMTQIMVVSLHPMVLLTVTLTRMEMEVMNQMLNPLPEPIAIDQGNQNGRSLTSSSVQGFQMPNSSERGTLVFCKL